MSLDQNTRDRLVPRQIPAGGIAGRLAVAVALALAVAWPTLAAAAPPCNTTGPLLIQQQFKEIACLGSAAQLQAQTNLGGPFTPSAIPTAPLLAGVAGTLTPVTIGNGLGGGGANPLVVQYGLSPNTALQGSLYGAANGVAPLDGSAFVPLANLPTIPASQTSGLLPLTGGTVPGTTNFTGAFQIGGTAQTFPMSGALVGLSDTQTLANKTINGGTLAGTLLGTPTFAGPLNTAAAAGFQQNGSTLITGGTSNAPITLAGQGAGAAQNLATGFWMAALGFDACNSDTNASAEETCVGSVAGLLNVSGTQLALGGSRAGGSMTSDSNLDVWGNDADRNGVGLGGSAVMGEGACRNGGNSGGVTASTCYGFFALRGNAGSVAVSGTKTTGDVITLTFTFGGAFPYALPGSPVAVTYTVLAGDTLATITTGLINAINASAGLQAASPVQVTAYDTDPVNPDAFGVDFAGTAATGSKIVITASVSGAATEVLTIGGGNSGLDNIANGDEACLYAEATTATLNMCAGKLSLSQQTVGVRDIAYGHFSGEFLSGATDSDNALFGFGAGQGALGLSTFFKVTSFGNLSCNALTAASNVVCGGYKAGLLATTLTNALLLGPNVASTLALTGTNVVIIGAGSNAEPPLATTSNYLGLFGVSTTAVMFATGTQTSTPTVTFPGGIVNVGLAGVQPGDLSFANATSGSISIAPPTGGLASRIITLPLTTTNADTFAVLATPQTFSAAQTFSSTLNVTGTLESGGTAGLASKTCTINTANAATGITITITGGLITGTTTC